MHFISVNPPPPGELTVQQYIYLSTTYMMYYAVCFFGNSPPENRESTQDSYEKSMVNLINPGFGGFGGLSCAGCTVGLVLDRVR